MVEWIDVLILGATFPAFLPSRSQAVCRYYAIGCTCSRSNYSNCSLADEVDARCEVGCHYALPSSMPSAPNNNNVTLMHATGYSLHIRPAAAAVVVYMRWPVLCASLASWGAADGRG